MFGLCCCAWAFSSCSEGGYSSLWCTDFSLRWLLFLWSVGSRHAGFSSCGSRALEGKLSSCGTWALLLRSMWDLPGPGLEPVSPALAGEFLTTAPPGKSKSLCETHSGCLFSFPKLSLRSCLLLLNPIKSCFLTNYSTETPCVHGITDIHLSNAVD